ncbi:hypothetical protein [Bdellovibrio sp. HCB337]|uniref:hypothetical protein n=1 Tax=Bdellovibrio sp. HCB337 TaxID=3394358 RepID=UPI0039A63AC9
MKQTILAITGSKITKLFISFALVVISSLSHADEGEYQLDCKSTESIDHPHYTANFSRTAEGFSVYATTRPSRFLFVEGHEYDHSSQCNFINNVMVECRHFKLGNDRLVEVVKFFRKMPGMEWKAQIVMMTGRPTANLKCLELLAPFNETL